MQIKIPEKQNHHGEPYRKPKSHLNSPISIHFIVLAHHNRENHPEQYFFIAKVHSSSSLIFCKFPKNLTSNFLFAHILCDFSIVLWNYSHCKWWKIFQFSTFMGNNKFAYQCIFNFWINLSLNFTNRNSWHRIMCLRVCFLLSAFCFSASKFQLYSDYNFLMWGENQMRLWRCGCFQQWKCNEFFGSKHWRKIYTLILSNFICCKHNLCSEKDSENIWENFPTYPCKTLPLPMNSRQWKQKFIF